METISDLIREHRQFENETSLKESLGDGLLFAKNPIFQALRSNVSVLGVTFTDQVITNHYQTCPHLSFKDILESKKIPYFKNVGALLEMEKWIPGLEIPKLLEIKKNKVMHESAHLVAHHILNQSPAQDSTDFFIFKTLLSESYASACETVGQVYLDNSVSEWMYRQNSNLFGCEGLEYRRLLLQICEKFGLRFCFNLATLSFLCWNFLFSSMNKKDIKQIVHLCAPSIAFNHVNWNQLLEFSNYHFLVRNWFRKEISEFYFRASGIQKPLSRIFEFNLINRLMKESDWQSYIHQLSGPIIENGSIQHAV